MATTCFVDDGLLDVRISEVESFNPNKKAEYFSCLNKYCEQLKKGIKTNITFTQKCMSFISKRIRNFDLEIKGTENVPNSNCLFVGNHSNIHDAFITAEVMTSLEKTELFLAAIEGLSPFELFLFKSARSTMINRTNKESSNQGLYDFAGKLINGNSGFLFGEGTWNLHPIKPMQNIKIGPAKVAAITNLPVVPIIYEYVETPDVCTKEKDLYTKCLVEIGEPIFIDSTISLVEQTQLIQSTMENVRRRLWKELKINKNSINEINPEVYVNHTWLKKYGTPLFEFNSERENKVLRSNDGSNPENEYYIDENGIFKPGIITKTAIWL